MSSLPRAVFISHGGGPLPLLGDPNHTEMILALQDLVKTFPRPKAIIVISAHWETNAPTISSAIKPPLFYDYYGFPPESYQIQYPCSGDPTLAQQIYDHLGENDIEANFDEERGLDHGVFVPLKLMYPEADIPVVQLSLLNTLDPMKHIKIGAALKEMHQQGVLVVGSGFSFHNMRAFFSADKSTSHLNESFENWLENTCMNVNLSESERLDLLVNWHCAPGARFCHPREEHLMPLHVCYGASKIAASKRIKVSMLGKVASIFVW